MAEEKSPPKSPIALREEEILQSWQHKKIFEKTLEKKSPEGEFVFYEGPPTANGRPGIHHLEARSYKDIIPRYKTMQGFHVRRKGGWDTHGLPVELEVEKQLGFKGKKDIENYGVAAFNEKCKESVWKYVDEWENFTKRIGFWVDLDHPYVTYEPSYMESVWSVIKNVYDQDLIYKDYRVVPWCPRCGTALSSHELAQGYADVKDLSVYVKFKLVGQENTYVVAWTTTPWTLPGNVALAVGENIKYMKIKSGDEYIIVAKDRMNVLSVRSPDGTFQMQESGEEIRGKDLIGLEYEPLYPFLNNNLPAEQKEKLKNAFKIYPADFVTTTDGTGIVHTAVMYGADDFTLGTKIGLPKFHLVATDGTFLPIVDFLAGKFVKSEEVDVEIIKNLAHRNLLFKKEKVEHTYPFCWRCKTPLIYYARDSWYIQMSSLRNKLIKENEGINWEPDHIKEGRFGEWLREVKDWAISRERYWGTPLPIWQSEDGTVREVIGSIEELRQKTTRNNTYFLMRHGESDNNVTGTVSSGPNDPYHLTEKGKSEVIVAAKKLKKEKIDVIFTSDFIRTRETADLVADTLGIPKQSIIVDERLREYNCGDLSGKSYQAWRDYWQTRNLDSFEENAPGGESPLDISRRTGAFIYDVDARYEGKNILVISHQDALWYTAANAAGKHPNDFRAEETGQIVFKNAEVRNVSFAQVPHDKDFMLDLHRPYIDAVTWKSKDGKIMRRVAEVMDVWFDSGAMPFAQDHYPFENKKYVDKIGYPADYISEAIDQTRGWFYTLHAVGVLLGKGKAYKNVICLGHLLDKEGAKMSKSKGNVVNPWEMIDKYGADALRFWMYTVNQPGESKNFDEKTVDDVIKKVFNLLLNVVKFYEMYATDGVEASAKSKHPLDRWIVARFEKLVADATRDLDAYKVLDPARAFRDFIADLSQWYIRLSRDRFKSDDTEDKAHALATTKYILVELSKVIAPFMPFLAEDVYLGVTRGKEMESVHLEAWPQAKKPDQKILDSMSAIRTDVSLGLEARARAGIKVRQPLASVSLKSKDTYAPELLELLKDELNVKEVLFNATQAAEVELDTNITEELKKEGNVRDLIRAIQEMRKKFGLLPNDVITVTIKTDAVGETILKDFENDIKKITGAKSIERSDIEGEALSLDGVSFTIRIQRI